MGITEKWRRTKPRLCFKRSLSISPSLYYRTEETAQEPSNVAKFPPKKYLFLKKVMWIFPWNLYIIQIEFQMQFSETLEEESNVSLKICILPKWILQRLKTHAALFLNVAVYRYTFLRFIKTTRKSLTYCRLLLIAYEKITPKKGNQAAKKYKMIANFGCFQ